MNWPLLILSGALAWLPFSVGAATFEIGPVTFTLYMAALCILCPLAALGHLFDTRPFGFRPVDLLILLLCASYLTSTLFARDPVGAGYLAVHAIAIPVASYYAVKATIQSERDYQLCILAVATGFALFCIVALVAFASSGMSTRIRVLSRDAIAVSTMSMITMIILSTSAHISFVARALGILAALGGLAASMARSYLVLLFITPVIWRAVRKGHAPVLLIIFLATTLGGTLFLSTNSDLLKARGWNPGQENSLERLTNIEYWKEGLHGRLLTFRESLRHFETAPLVGTGLRPPDELGSTVHNFHLEWLEYGGLIGYFLCAGILLAHAASTRELARTDPWTAANLTIIILLYANGLTNGMMHGLMPYLLFIVVGLNEARLNLARHTDGSRLGLSANDLSAEPRVIGAEHAQARA